jgi:hypothetical protein
MSELFEGAIIHHTTGSIMPKSQDRAAAQTTQDKPTAAPTAAKGIRIGISGKVVGLALASIVIMLAVVVTVIVVKSRTLESEVQVKLVDQAYSQIEQINNAAISLLESQNATLLNYLQNSAAFAEVLIQDAGGLHVQSQTVSWQAVNQISKKTQAVDLPRVNLGETWLGQNTDPQQATPLVDSMLKMGRLQCTVFQRMNDAGDMLRIATNIQNTAGQRAVGTFIPAVADDGKPNAVVASLLANKTYTGRAFVVDRWCLTLYQPLKDATGRVIGALYVGLPLDQLNTTRQALDKIVVGKTGYVYGIGVGDRENLCYTFSPGGKRDGEFIGDTKDAKGALFIRELVKKAVEADGKSIQVSYTFPALTSRASTVYVRVAPSEGTCHDGVRHGGRSCRWSIITRRRL